MHCQICTEPWKSTSASETKSRRTWSSSEQPARTCHHAANCNCGAQWAHTIIFWFFWNAKGQKVLLCIVIQNILLTRAWRSCLSEFDLPGAGSLLGGTRPSNETGAMMEQIVLEKCIATHTIFAAHVSCHFLISCVASRNELGHFEGVTLPDRSMSPLAASLKNVGLWLSFYLTIQLIS